MHSPPNLATTPLDHPIPSRTPPLTGGEGRVEEDSAPLITDLNEWKMVVACADSFAAAAKRVQGLVFKTLALAILAWGAGVTVYWESGGTLLLVLGGVTLIPLFLLAVCGYMLFTAMQFPRIVTETGAALNQLQAAHRTDVVALIRTHRWKGFLRILDGLRKLCQALQTFEQLRKEEYKLLASAVALCSPVFWLALAAAVLAAGVQSVVIALAALLRVFW